MRPLTRPPLALAAALSLLAGAASAQTDPAALVGQTVFATGGTTFTGGAAASEPSPDWTAIGRVSGVAMMDGAPVALLELEGVGAEIPVMLDQLQLVADADDPGTVFVLSQIDAETLASRAEEIERDRLAEVAAADRAPFEQDAAAAEEARPEAEADGAEANGAAVVVIDPDAGADLPPEVDPAPAQAEAPREVDIADPDAPPIEDAETVVPQNEPDQARVPELAAETELSSPTHTAATPVEPGTPAAEPPAAAPENFAPVDMSTMDPTQLLNVRVYTLDDENIGQIDRWVGEGEGGLPESAVVDVGGFLGIGGRDVAIGRELMTLLAEADGNGLRVYVDLTEEQIEALPELSD